MVLRHFTSHQDVVQDEKVDSPHAHLTSDGPETEQSDTRAPRLGPLPSSIPDPKAHHAESHTAGRGLSDSTNTTTNRSDNNEQGLRLSHQTEKTSMRGEDGHVRTEISGDSWVLNGDAKSRPQTDVTRTHIITGGAITRGSTLVNGDTDHDTFMKVFGRSR